MHSGIFRARQLGIFLFFLLSFFVLAARLFYLQAIDHEFYYKIANQQHIVSAEIPAKRGTIFDRNMQVLAVNINTDSIFANPRIIKNKKKVSADLSKALNMDAGKLYDRLSRDKGFVWIKRKITPEESKAIAKLNIEGIDMVKESKRVYPDSELACHLLGVVDIDNNGLEGLELRYNKYLKGKSGLLVSTQDAKRELLESFQDELVQPKNGNNLILTIDEVIQGIAERELLKALERTNAKAASIIVMDPKTGAILALANLPNYDLNDLNRRNEDAIRNRAVNDFFEPGSIFKAITASALLNEKVVSVDDTFFCENGEWKYGRNTLHDVHPYGELTFRQVIEKSSNIGTVKAAGLLGPDKMYEYIGRFGFLERTGLDLPGEVVGINRPPQRWSNTSMYAIPMGQETTVTSIQLACAISAIANGGNLVKPRIVSEIIDDSGETVKRFSPVVRREVISADTAAQMRQILNGVVERGTGRKARMEDYKAGGKTGTAQKVENGTYSDNKYMASFIGFAPVEDPALVVVVNVNEPYPVYYGGDVAAPVFKAVVDNTLKYMNAKGIKTL